MSSGPVPGWAPSSGSSTSADVQWPRRNRALAAVLAIAVFVASCAAPAVRFDDGSTWPGYILFGTGWLGPLVGIGAWFANLPGLGALLPLAFGGRRWVVVLSVIAVLLGLTMVGFPNTEVPLDEAFVNKVTVVALEPGAWLWLASLAIPGIAALVLGGTTDHA